MKCLMSEIIWTVIKHKVLSVIKNATGLSNNDQECETRAMWRSEVYPSLQKYSYLKEWSFNTLPIQGISLAYHHLFSTALKQQWHQQLPSLLSGSPRSLAVCGRADRQTDVTVILYLLQILLLHGQQVAPGDVIFLCMYEKHHSAFTESKLLQLLLTPLP